MNVVARDTVASGGRFLAQRPGTHFRADAQHHLADVFPHNLVRRGNGLAPSLPFQPRFVRDYLLNHGDLAPQRRVGTIHGSDRLPGTVDPNRPPRKSPLDWTVRTTGPALHIPGHPPTLAYFPFRMTFRRLAALITVAALAVPAVRSQEAANPAAELKALVGKISAKLQAGNARPTDLAPDLAAFDALRAKYKDSKTDEVAQIHYMQATLLSQVLDDDDAANKLLKGIVANFAGTPTATRAERTLVAIERAAAAKAAQAALVGKPAPALNFKWSSGAPLKTLADLKGKVVVLDFWATWCGPCISSFPQVRELTAHYKGADVVVLGVTSLQGSVSNLGPSKIDTRNDPAREMALMTDFIKAKDITWTVAFSEEPVFNPAYGVTGIPHMAIIAPDGTVRHTGMHPASPHAEKVEKIDALLKEFGKPVPAAKG